PSRERRERQGTAGRSGWSSAAGGADRDRSHLGLGSEEIAAEGVPIAPALARQNPTHQRELLLGAVERERAHRDGTVAVRLDPVAHQLRGWWRQRVVHAEQQRHPVIDLEQLVVVPALLLGDPELPLAGFERALLLGHEGIHQLAHLAREGQTEFGLEAVPAAV